MLIKLKTENNEIEIMSKIINLLWPFVQFYLKKELGNEVIKNFKAFCNEN